MPYTPQPYNKYETLDVPEEQPGIASDFAYTTTSAVNKGLAGIARTVDTLVGDGIDGEFINRLEENARYGQEQLSDRQKEANQKEFISSNEGETFGEAWSDPRAYLNVGAAGLGSMVPIVAGGGLLSRATQKGLSVAGAKGLAGLASAGSYGAIEGAMVGGGVAGDIQAAVNAMPDDVIATSPRMQELFDSNVAKGLDDENAFSEARAQLGREAGVSGMKDTVPLSVLFGTVAGRFLDKAITGKLTGGRLKNAVTGAAIEGSTEGVQGGIEHYATQSTLSQIDPSIDPQKGLGNAIVTEGLGGGMIGGGMGAISRSGGNQNESSRGDNDTRSNDKPAEQNIDARGTEGANAAEFDAAGVELPADDALRQPIEEPAEQFSKSTLEGAKALGSIGDDVLEKAAIQNFTDDQTLQVINYLLNVKAKKEADQSNLARGNQEQRKLTRLVDGIDAEQNNDAVINDEQKQDARQRFEKPEFKIIPDAEKIIQNRSVKGIDLRQFIDDRETNKDSYNPLAGAYEKPQYKINEQKETQSEKAPVTKEFKPTHTDETGEQYQFLTGDQYLDENGEQWTFEPEELDSIQQTAKANDAPVGPNDSQVSEQAQQAIQQNGGNNPSSRKGALNETESVRQNPVKDDATQTKVPIDPNDALGKNQSNQQPYTQTTKVEPGAQADTQITNQWRRELSFPNKTAANAWARKNLKQDYEISNVQGDPKLHVIRTNEDVVEPEYWYLDADDMPVLLKQSEVDGERGPFAKSVIKKQYGLKDSDFKQAKESQIKSVSPDGRANQKADGMVDGNSEKRQSVSSEEEVNESKKQDKQTKVSTDSDKNNSLEDSTENESNVLERESKRQDKPSTIQDKVQDSKTGADTVEVAEKARQRKSKATGEVAEKGQNNLTDFGEKLGGARKDEFVKMTDAVKEMTDDDIASLPLSKIFPKKIIDDTDDIYKAAYLTALRESIPAKPRKSILVKVWIKKVKDAMELIEGFDAMKSSDVLSAMRKPMYLSLNSFADKIELLQNIDREQWSRIGGVADYSNAYSYKDGKKVLSPNFLIEVDGKMKRIDGALKVSDTFEKVKELLSSEVDKKQVEFELRGNVDGYFINKKGDKEYRKLKIVSSVEEGRKYIKENYDDLVKAWEEVKDRDNVKKSDVRSKANKPRTGQDYRKGKDVDEAMFMDAFGFRGVEFGNWVKQGKSGKDRQGLLNQTYDAFKDLANILNIPDKAISLNGSLGLGLGSRGRGGFAAAHYEPENIVINLTKTKGAGSLAHEWFHALDNYFSRQRDGEVKVKPGLRADQAYREGNFITYRPEALYKPKNYSSKSLTKQELERYRKLSNKSKLYVEENWELDKDHPKGVRREVESKFAELVETLNDSPMRNRSERNDKTPNDGYWSRIIERGARAFENYVIAKMQKEGYDNDFLANVVDINNFVRNKERYPYLLPEEMAPVEQAFDNLFGTLKTKNTEKGVALYSKSQKTTGSTKEQVISWLPKRIQQKVGSVVEIVQSVDELPDTLKDTGKLLLDSSSLQGIEGLYDTSNGSDTIYLIADMLNQENVLAVAQHELLHRSLATDTKLKNQLANLNRRLQVQFNRAAKGKASEIENKAYKRVIDAETPVVDQLNEFAAYLVSEYNNKPDSLTGVIRRWIQDRIAAIRAALIRVGFLPKEITPADLNALAGYGLKSNVSPTNKESPVLASKAPKLSKGNNSSWRNQPGFEGLTSEQFETLGKIGSPPNAPLGNKLKDQFDKHRYLWREKLKQGIFDQYDSFKSILNDNRAWMMANTSSTGGAVVESAIEFGMPFLDKSGAIDLNTKEKSLGQIFEPLGDEIDRFMMWIAGNRSQRLSKEDRERLFSGADIQNLIDLSKGQKDGESREALYQKVRADFEAMNNAFVKIGVDTGLVSKTDANIWKDQGFYVPFYRLAEDMESAKGPASASGLVKQQAYKKLKGADMQLNNLLSNTIMNWNHLVNASLKNQAATKALETAVNIEIAEEIQAKDKSKKSIFIRQDGKERWFDVNESQEGQLVLDSLNALNWNGLNNFAMKVMRKFKRALTIGVTASPEFKVANLLRDSIQAIAVSDMSTNIAKNLRDGFKYSAKNQDTKARMIAGGGAFGDSGYIHGADPDAIKLVIKKGMDRANILDTRNKFKAVWDAYQDFGARLENINRMANFEQALEQGKDLLTANFEARDQLDFQRTGSFVSVRALAQIIPFLNARLQGLNKLGRAMSDPKQRKQFNSVVGVYSAISILLYLAMKDDDDYKQAEHWERDTYHLIKVPGTDTMLRIPRPFEVGAIANMLERGVEQLVDDKVHGKLFAERLQHALTQTLSIDIVPQAVKPINEVWANKSAFTGRDIESQAMKRLSPTERKKVWTSQTAIGLSKTMDAILWDEVVLSPIQIEHIVNGYLGWAGATVLSGIDMFARPLVGAPERPERTLHEMPVIGRFIRDNNSRNSRFITEFYDKQKELQMVFNDIKQYRENQEFDKASEKMDEYRDELRYRKLLNRTQKRLSDLNKRIVLITKSDISPEQKRTRIDRINAMRVDVARRVVDKLP